MKGRKKEGDGRTAARKWVTIRVTEREKTRLTEQAEIAGLSLSEYMRRRFFGGRPLVAHTDLSAVAELRRIGGLLKHNFETLRQAKAPPDSGAPGRRPAETGLGHPENLTALPS